MSANDERPAVILSAEESWQFLDQRAREVTGLSAAQFLANIERGDYDDLPDDASHRELLRLIMLFTGGK